MAKNLSNLRAPKKPTPGASAWAGAWDPAWARPQPRPQGPGSRSGFSLMRGFEGGQMPLHRRLPKRGFTNIFRTEYTVVNLDRIAETIADLKSLRSLLRTTRSLASPPARRRSSRFSIRRADQSAYHPRPQVFQVGHREDRKSRRQGRGSGWRRGAGNGLSPAGSRFPGPNPGIPITLSDV